jgi:hypothetical protein
MAAVVSAAVVARAVVTAAVMGHGCDHHVVAAALVMASAVVMTFASVVA